MKTAAFAPPGQKTAPRLNRAEVMRIVRFGIVGASGTLLNTGVVWVLLSFGHNHLGWHPADHSVVTGVAALSWVICCGTNYILS